MSFRRDEVLLSPDRLFHMHATQEARALTTVVFTLISAYTVDSATLFGRRKLLHLFIFCNCLFLFPPGNFPESLTAAIRDRDGGSGPQEKTYVSKHLRRPAPTKCRGSSERVC